MNINELLKTVNYNPDKFVIMNFAFNNEIIGRLVVENNQLKFEGEGKLSALIFFNECLKPYIDQYLNRIENTLLN